MFNLAVAGFCAWSSWESFKAGNERWGWINLVLSALNAAVFLAGVV